MIVLLDEPLPHRLRTAIGGHDVSTTAYRGWDGLKNGVLLRTAEEAGVQVFVTCDQSVPEQQNLRQRRLGVVVLSKQEWPRISEHIMEVQRAVDLCMPGSVTNVDRG